MVGLVGSRAHQPEAVRRALGGASALELRSQGLARGAGVEPARRRTEEGRPGLKIASLCLVSIHEVLELPIE